MPSWLNAQTQAKLKTANASVGLFDPPVTIYIQSQTGPESIHAKLKGPFRGHGLAQSTLYTSYIVLYHFHPSWAVPGHMHLLGGGFEDETIVHMHEAEM